MIMKKRAPAKRPRWLPVDDVVLRDMYMTHTSAQVGDKLGRTAEAVRIRARKLGIRKIGVRNGK